MKILTFLFVAFLASLPESTLAQYNWSKIVSTGDDIPNSTGDFQYFFGEVSLGPSIDSGSILFDARGTSGERGVYCNKGGSLFRIADTTTSMPSVTGKKFKDFGTVVFRRGNAVFRGISSDWVGIYQYNTMTSTLSKLVDYNTAIPGGTGNFGDDHEAFGPQLTFPVGLDPTEAAPNFVFCGGGSNGQMGEYIYANGTVSKVMDMSTPIPSGSGNFTGIHPFGDMHSGNVAFVGSGSNGQMGVYLFKLGSIRMIANTSTSIPGGNGSFTSFGALSIEDTNIAFIGFGNGNQTGIYTYIDGALSKLVDRNTSIPGMPQNFKEFGLYYSPMLRDKKVVFHGYHNTQGGGLYTNATGTGLTKVIATGDTVDNLEILGSGTGPKALAVDGSGKLVTQVDFVAGGVSLYVGTPSSPAPIASVPVIRENSVIYPNPFRESVRIISTLSKGAVFEIFDSKGGLVRRLDSAFDELQWDGRDHQGLEVPAGTYFCYLMKENVTMPYKIQKISR